MVNRVNSCSDQVKTLAQKLEFFSATCTAKRAQKIHELRNY
ncbi:hypothetical protein RVR34_22625 [Microcystis aeruginosa FBCC-A68]|nr:hypothetical protein [Microcystis sp. LE19-195.1E]